MDITNIIMTTQFMQDTSTHTHAHQHTNTHFKIQKLIMI